MRKQVLVALLVSTLLEVLGLAFLIAGAYEISDVIGKLVFGVALIYMGYQLDPVRPREKTKQ